MFLESWEYRCQTKQLTSVLAGKYFFSGSRKMGTGNGLPGAGAYCAGRRKENDHIF